MREPSHARSQGGRRPAGGACGGARHVMRVLGGAEHLVEGVRAGAEFRRVRFGVNDAALRLDHLDHDIRALGHEIREDRGALRRAHARDIRQVLDRHRQAREGAPPLRGKPKQGIGALARPIQAQGGKRVHDAIDFLDARLERVEQVMGRYFATPQPRDESCRRLADQFRTHALSSLPSICLAVRDQHAPNTRRVRAPCPSCSSGPSWYRGRRHSPIAQLVEHAAVNR